MEAARPDLEAVLRLQAALLRETLAESRPPEVPRDSPRSAAVLCKLHTGVPLLADEPLCVDIHYSADLFERLLNVALRRGDADTAARAAPLIAAAADGRLDPREVFTEALVRHQDHVAAIAASIGVNEDFLGSLASLAVAPQLRAYAASVSGVIEHVADQTAWGRGYCPACGGAPLLGELRGVELRLFLRCSACGLAWRSRRLFCPFCEADDHQLLRTLRVQGDHRFSAQVCNRCSGYLKIGNAFEPPPAALLPLDDLASVDLDAVALERGYARPREGFRLGHPPATTAAR
jgi:FdhE protein